jgi:hypothetical protein
VWYLPLLNRSCGACLVHTLAVLLHDVGHGPLLQLQAELAASQSRLTCDGGGGDFAVWGRWRVVSVCTTAEQSVSC